MNMRVGIVSPVAWRTPPRHYGPWEQFVSLLTEGLVEEGMDVTLYATGDSITKAKLEFACQRSYEEDGRQDPKVCEYLHISKAIEESGRYDILHNSFDFMPLTYSKLIKTPMLTTIHGFSSPKILPIYEKYNENTHYVSISDANRNEKLNYIKTIYHGIRLDDFEFREEKEEILLFFGRIHPDKGTFEAIQIARKLKMRLIIAGIIQDKSYFEEKVSPYLGDDIEYIGSVGPEKRSVLLGKAKALLHPIYFEEPFGFSVVEAMACGTPVIAFDKGSMPELISNGWNGFLVQDIEQAVECAKDLNRIKPQNCRNIVEERFSQKKMVGDYIKVYKRICGHA
jgi:glycosyltransferase involved in cell wall biosynthesis